MVEINITGGLKVLVDIEDYEKLSKYSWHRTRAHNKDKCGNTLYYSSAKIDGKIVLMHRFIMGAKSEQIIDHINKNSLDNRKANLRFVTHSENCHNIRNKKNSFSNYRGVYRHHNKFIAKLKINKKQCYLGLFDTQELAAEACNKKLKEVYGGYAQLNEIQK